jgi:hypothetical protein
LVPEQQWILITRHRLADRGEYGRAWTSHWVESRAEKRGQWRRPNEGPDKTASGAGLAVAWGMTEGGEWGSRDAPSTGVRRGAGRGTDRQAGGPFGKCAGAKKKATAREGQRGGRGVKQRSGGGESAGFVTAAFWRGGAGSGGRRGSRPGGAGRGTGRSSAGCGSCPSPPPIRNPRSP